VMLRGCQRVEAAALKHDTRFFITTLWFEFCGDEKGARCRLS
jgi:hypothetical protein